MALDSRVITLEVSKSGNLLKMSFFEQGDAVSAVRHYAHRTISIPEINRLSHELASLLNGANKKGILDDEKQRSMEKIGQLLFDQLLSKPIKDKIRSSQEKSSLALLLDEELINIPWEFLFDGKEFLCVKFSLGRLINSSRAVSSCDLRSMGNRLKMLIIANPTGDLSSAYAEGHFIKNKFDRRRSKVSIDFKSSNIDTFYVKKNLRDYDIVHFAGHCEYDAENIKRSGWVFSDGRFCAGDIISMGETLALPSLVFSNACQSARQADDGIGFNYQQKVFSLASAFLFSGVRHYIGSVRKIEDNISLIFAREFYTSLILGRSVGESIKNGRIKLIKEFGKNSVFWMSYILYGNPDFVLFKNRRKKFLRRVRFVLPGNMALIRKILAAAIIISVCAVLFWKTPSVNPGGYVRYSQALKLFEQGKNADAVIACKKVIDTAPDILSAYSLMAKAYHRQADLNNAIRAYFDYAMRSQKINSKKDISLAYIELGWLYHQEGNYPKALDFYNKALELSVSNKDKVNEAVSLRKIALWNIDKNLNDKALELLMKSVVINRERQVFAEHRYNLACDYFDIGLVFSNKNDFKAAREFYAKSFEIFRKLKLKHELSDYYFNLGELYLFDKDYIKALDCYNKGLKIDLSNNNLASVAEDYNMIGELYLEMNDATNAENYFKMALNIIKGSDLVLTLATTYYDLGILYKGKGQKNKAKQFLRLSQEIYSTIDTPDYQRIKEEILSIE